METVIGLLVFTLAVVAAGQLLRVFINPLLVTERQRVAGKQSESLLNDLAARQSATLPDGGSFTVDAQGNPVRNADSTITLNCSTSYCDQIITAQGTGTERSYSRLTWGATLPAGASQTYVRAWRISTIDASRRLRRVTIAVFPAGESYPLSVQTLNVVLR